jgi:hypothetical protein
MIWIWYSVHLKNLNESKIPKWHGFSVSPSGPDNGSVVRCPFFVRSSDRFSNADNGHTILIIAEVISSLHRTPILKGTVLLFVGIYSACQLTGQSPQHYYWTLINKPAFDTFKNCNLNSLGQFQAVSTVWACSINVCMQTTERGAENTGM